jgi:hypothetical protein
MRCWPRWRRPPDRVVIIEDTRELQCAAPNLVAMRTKDGVATLSDLVRSSLRLRPDRIPIGEVRGAEALDLLKAWGTGHPGGIGTIHAGTGIGALRRLEQLIQEAVVTVPRALIAETIDLVAVLPAAAPRAGSPNSPASRARPDGDYACRHHHHPRHHPRRPFMILHALPRFRAASWRPPPRRCFHQPDAGARRPCLRLVMPWEAAAASDPPIDRRAGRQDHRRDHHHRHRPDAGLRRHLRRLPPPDPDRLRPVIAFAASSFFLSFFSFGGGALV